MHSTSFFDRKRGRLYIVMGGSGSGKSTVLLKAISLGGVEIFGTELTHFTFAGGTTRMLKGSLWQNCRMGNLVFDFPELLARFGMKAPQGDPWHSYESVSLESMQVPENELDSVPMTLVMPRIEGERITSSIRKAGAASTKGALFQNLSDKVSPPTLLWGTRFVPSVDTDDIADGAHGSRLALRRIGSDLRVLERPVLAAGLPWTGYFPDEKDTRMNTPGGRR